MRLLALGANETQFAESFINLCQNHRN